MKTWIKGTVTALLLATVASTTPGQAAEEGPQAWLYELTENMSVKGLKAPSRKATSQLMGYAILGSPLCPADLVARVNPYAGFCTINATGSDSISLLTGLGNFGGSFTVVVQDVNPFDSPEVVVAKGRFNGKMDFRPAILAEIPLGSVEGTMVLNSGPKVPFKGTFRLPTAPIADRRLAGYCRVPNQVPPDWCLKPLYLLDDYTSTVDVLPDERALGYPTVRFEITF
jgi:hypothetical protein